MADHLSARTHPTVSPQEWQAACDGLLADYEAGCPVNSSMVDGFDGLVPQLHARDLTLMLVSRAPLEAGAVSQTYTTTWRGLEFIMGYYPMLDRAPKGRDEGDDDGQTAIRRHDEYGLGVASDRPRVGPARGRH